MKRLILLFTAVLLLFLCACGQASQEEQIQDTKQDQTTQDVSKSKDESKKEQDNVAQEPSVEEDKIVYMGTYEQDNNLTNGKEPIEWDVVAVEGDKALLVSRYALQPRAFNDVDKAATWEESSLRRWLNEDFLQDAFTDEERACILESAITAENNPQYDTDGGNDTLDRVFILSASEFNTYYPSEVKKGYPPTAYAEANGAFAYTSGSCMVWLRNPGKIPNSACFLFATAGVNADGGYINSSDISVCPAIWVDYTTN